MFNKNLWLLLLTLALVFTLASCTEECSHVDADDDYNCDKCGEHFDDGDEGNGGEEVTLPTVIFSVALDNGNPVSGVKLTLTRSANTYNLTTGSDGRAETKLPAGAYYVDYDYETLPEGCLPDTFGVKIAEGTNEISLILVDNNEDGSARKPFTVAEESTSITLAAGEELYYRYKGSSIKYLSVDSDDVVVNFNSDSYSLSAGNLPLTITPQIGEETIFTMKNASDSEISFTLILESPEGSYDNPHELTEDSLTVTVNCDTIIYYSWVAPADGIVTLVSLNERNNILLRKVLEGDVPVDRQTNGNSSVYMEVAKGDVITIGVSALEGGDKQPYDVEISFTLVMEYYD